MYYLIIRAYGLYFVKAFARTNIDIAKKHFQHCILMQKKHQPFILETVTGTRSIPEKEISGVELTTAKAFIPYKTITVKVLDNLDNGEGDVENS